MNSPLYSIGIDLGTSNCALAYVDHAYEDLGTQILMIPQKESENVLSELDVLPSFLHFSTKNRQASGDVADSWKKEMHLGAFAKEQSAHVPGRVISSAKSWLCHRGVDREAKILPWGSKEIEPSSRLSPVSASAAYLDYLKYVWDQRVAQGDEEKKFKNQNVFITVPASFDSVAQKLTLEAAKSAGYPDNIRLLEEPQAALYYWFENNKNWESHFGEMIQRDKMNVLVCDIGGGTTDFSLFEVGHHKQIENRLNVERIAVSDHILLGGDNLDLMLAHCFEQQMGEKLSDSAWHQLIAQSRSLKEGTFQDKEQDLDEPLHVSVTGGGSSLFASSKTAKTSRGEIIQNIVDGFFPIVEKDEIPVETASGIREVGLPYAEDPAITKHLARFVDSRKIDLVLFNGGTVKSERLQNRICDQIARWQEGVAPESLYNKSADLAVAHGASYSAWFRYKFGRDVIGGGAAHSIYIQVEKQETKTSLKKKRKGKLKDETYVMCVLPMGAGLDQDILVEQKGMQLLVNTAVEFKPYSSTRRSEDQPGDLVALNNKEFVELPSMQTIASVPKEDHSETTVPIAIESKLNSVGLLQLYCLNKQDQKYKWELIFNLRGSGKGIEGSSSKVAEVDEEKLIHAFKLIQGLYPPPGKKADHLCKAAGLLKQIEALTGSKRGQWDLSLLRRYWEDLGGGINQRYRSVDHELSWLMAAGYSLRPGYGVALDETRIQNLWMIRDLGLSFPKDKAVREQFYIMMRRIVGGLDESQQLQLFEAHIDLVKEHIQQGAEAVRLLGSCERLSFEHKKQLVGYFLEGLQLRSNKNCDYYLWALGRILSRVPLYTGIESIVPASTVVGVYEELCEMDWTSKKWQGISSMWGLAARVTQNREIDLPEDIRIQVATKLEALNESDRWVRAIREYVPMEKSDYQTLFGESLPVGFIL